MKKKLLMGMAAVMMMTTVMMGNAKQCNAALHFRDKGDWCIPQGQTITEWDYCVKDGKKFVEDSKIQYRVANPSILKAVTVKKYGEKINGFKALKAGITTVTVTYKGKTLKTKVKVFSNFKMPTIKIKSTRKKFQVSVTNPNSGAITFDKNKVIEDVYGESGGFGPAKIAGGHSVKIPAHATRSFCLTTKGGDPIFSDACRFGINYKGYKFTISQDCKKRKANLVNPTWLDI